MKKIYYRKKTNAKIFILNWRNANNQNETEADIYFRNLKGAWGWSNYHTWIYVIMNYSMKINFQTLKSRFFCLFESTPSIGGWAAIDRTKLRYTFSDCRFRTETIFTLLLYLEIKIPLLLCGFCSAAARFRTANIEVSKL